VHTGPYDQVVISGENHLVYSLLGSEFRVSSGSFFQTNFDSAALLAEPVLSKAAGLSGTLFDLYSGVGLFSAILGDQFERIVAVEGSHSACEDYAHNLKDGGDIDLYEGNVEHLLRDISDQADCVVVDPPRGGLHRYAVDALVNKKAQRVIYVSCNPATLGRDIKRLGKGGYELKRSVIVDMFPQTYHIESVNLLELR
jgi:23S rRNA (uracil1939-C5)-methyltransferase